MSEREPRPARVMVALGADATGQAALEAAVQLAATLRAELAGLFIEDVNLLRMAELPFSREFGLASGVARPIAAIDVTRALKSAAAQARGAVAKAAQSTGVQWTFEVVQGSGLAPLLAARRSVDWLVMERARVSAGGAPYPTLLKRPKRSAEDRATRRPVAVVFDGSAEAERATRAAHKLAHELSTSLLVLLLPRADTSISVMRAAARHAVGENHSRPHYVAVPEAGIEAIAAAVRRHHAAVLVWCDSAVRDDPQRLSEALSALSCPLVLTD
jgi:hypothetical protein